MKSKRLEHNAAPCPDVEPIASVMAFNASDARTIAEVVVRNALKWVGTRTRRSIDEVVKSLNQGDVTAHRELKLGLARHIAEYLGFLDEDVKAVFVADHMDQYAEDGNEPERRWVVHLVIFANPKTAALTSLVNALDRALTRALQESGAGVETERFLDVQLVNSAELENLARYAALLRAPKYLPTRVWQREAREAHSPDRVAPLSK